MGFVMTNNRDRQFNSAIMAVLYPILGVLPGMFHYFYWFPGLPLLLVVVGLIAGARSLSDALSSAPEIRPAAIALYIPVMASFIVGFCILLSVFFHFFWSW
jgi:hypothetical protein